MALPDSFTGAANTTLNTYDPLWVKSSNYTGFLKISDAGTEVVSSDANSSAYYYNHQPLSADYDVSADVTFVDQSSAFAVAGRVRIDGVNTMYFARWNSGLQLYKLVNTTATQLGSTVAQTVSNGSTHNIKLSMSGSTIKLFFDGVEKISVTDTEITATGYPGVRTVGGNTSKLDNFDVTNMSAGNTIAVPAAALTLSGLAPTVAQTAHNTIAVPAGTLALTGYAPSVSNSASNVIEVPTGMLALTGYEPTVAVSGDGNTISVPLGTLTLTGLAPTVWNYPRIVTPQPLKNNTATALSSETGAVVFVHNPATGALVVKKAGLTTDAGGYMAFQDSSLSPATDYRCVFQLASGAEGLATITSQ